MVPSLLPSTPVPTWRKAFGLRTLLLVAWLSFFFLAACATPTATRPTMRANEPSASAAADSSAAAEAESEVDDDALDPDDSTSVPEPPAPERRVLVVRASAYNSRRGQTDSSPNVAAWGDRLKPGMKVIAVSKDLLELGLVRGQRVQIAGLEGEYVVLDRMPARWREKIDIYMGTDVRAALNWGVRHVEISWVPVDETSIANESGASSGADSE